MSPKSPKRRKKGAEPEDEAALAAETAAAAPPAGDADDAPAADVERTETTDAEIVAATDAVDDAPEGDETEATAAETPSASAATTPPTSKPARKPSPEAPSGGKRAGGKVARDKHGRPVVDGPVVQAHAKYVRTSARKARLVCDHIRGKSVDEAVAILAHTPRAVAEDWEKLLKSAVANAEHNHELLGDDLRIHAVFADEGPTIKRFRPRAMGRATPIRKRTSHLTIQLTPKEQ
jgi:ribosomal protein L22